MKELKLYQCEICGTEYKDKIQAEVCEKNHVKTIEIVECKYVRKALREDGFPAYITVRSEEGKKKTYRL